MHIDRRLETIANLVPQGCVLADIGTDHAYLPVWLLEKQRIARAMPAILLQAPARRRVLQWRSSGSMSMWRCVRAAA